MDIKTRKFEVVRDLSESPSIAPYEQFAAAAPSGVSDHAPLSPPPAKRSHRAADYALLWGVMLVAGPLYLAWLAVLAGPAIVWRLLDAGTRLQPSR